MTIEGCVLEVDRERGVLYVHDSLGFTLLRMCGLPTPVPEPRQGELLDVTLKFGEQHFSWRGESPTGRRPPGPSLQNIPTTIEQELLAAAHWFASVEGHPPNPGDPLPDGISGVAADWVEEHQEGFRDMVEAARGALKKWPKGGSDAG